MANNHDLNAEPDFAPFIPTARAWGIARSKAIELANAGLLDTFLIGRRRFIYLRSLRELPQRLAELATKQCAYPAAMKDEGNAQ